MNPQVGYPAPSAPPRPLASSVNRWVARILDGLILFVPVALFFIVLFGIPLFLSLASSEGNGASEGGVLLWMFVAFVGYVLAIAATLALTYWYAVKYQVRHGGQTLGKRWRGIRVVGLDGAGMTAPQARRRWLASDGVAVLGSIPFLGALIGIYVLLDNLWLLWDKPNKQCAHDKYAKTIVVEAADG
ncbi:RDD family protein [Cryptosporangium sp. NPDC048952]|uniref:RDD family protein n=1 Tax=Cryptosporangium sp. NPDC048952 TaxID=3363961 RepID=UPI00371949D2